MYTVLEVSVCVFEPNIRGDRRIASDKSIYRQVPKLGANEAAQGLRNAL